MYSSNGKRKFFFFLFLFLGFTRTNKEEKKMSLEVSIAIKLNNLHAMTQKHNKKRTEKKPEFKMYPLVCQTK